MIFCNAHGDSCCPLAGKVCPTPYWKRWHAGCRSCAAGAAATPTTSRTASTLPVRHQRAGDRVDPATAWRSGAARTGRKRRAPHRRRSLSWQRLATKARVLSAAPARASLDGDIRSPVRSHAFGIALAVRRPSAGGTVPALRLSSSRPICTLRESHPRHGSCCVVNERELRSLEVKRWARVARSTGNACRGQATNTTCSTP